MRDLNRPEKEYVGVPRTCCLATIRLRGFLIDAQPVACLRAAGIARLKIDLLLVYDRQDLCFIRTQCEIARKIRWKYCRKRLPIRQTSNREFNGVRDEQVWQR